MATTEFPSGGDGSEPLLLLKSVAFHFRSHGKLLDFLLYELEFGRTADTDRKRRLNDDVAKHVASYLIVPRVIPASVRAVGCSSTDGSHPLAECLSLNQNTWWISDAESMPGGRGAEYVEFQLSSTLCRLSRVGIQIPPLPHGPLSVREFVIHAFDAGVWETISPTWTCENVSAVQHFAFDPPGVDVQFVRVVCLSNQYNELYNNRLASFNFDRVGFFTVTFD